MDAKGFHLCKYHEEAKGMDGVCSRDNGYLEGKEERVSGSDSHLGRSDPSQVSGP